VIGDQSPRKRDDVSGLGPVRPIVLIFRRVRLAERQHFRGCRRLANIRGRLVDRRHRSPGRENTATSSREIVDIFELALGSGIAVAETLEKSPPRAPRGRRATAPCVLPQRAPLLIFQLSRPRQSYNEPVRTAKSVQSACEARTEWTSCREPMSPLFDARSSHRSLGRDGFAS